MAGSRGEASFKPALLVVDMQEDFCPPEGSLAIAGGREIAPTINELLSLPFVLKIATRDFHPHDHISFDSSNAPPNNKAFQSSVKISNPNDPSQSHEIPIWPVHCVQGTKGAEIIPEIDASDFDAVVEKGKECRVEMFSAFTDVFGSKSPVATNMDLARLLKVAGITHVFTVGLAGDFCVRCTACDAKKEGFEVCVIEEATKCVNTGGNGWDLAKEELGKAGVQVVHINGPEVHRVRSLR